MAMYLASVVESVTEGCRLLFHDTTEPYTKYTNPVVDRLVSLSPA